jgi:hypothetical protein
VVSPRRPKVISAQSMGSPLRKELNTCPRDGREVSSEHGAVVEQRNIKQACHPRRPTQDSAQNRAWCHHRRQGKQRFDTVTHRTTKANRCNTFIHIS